MREASDAVHSPASLTHFYAERILWKRKRNQNLSFTTFFLARAVAKNLKLGDKVRALRNGLDFRVGNHKVGQTRVILDFMVGNHKVGQTIYDESRGNGLFDYAEGDEGIIIGVHNNGSFDILTQGKLEYYQVLSANWVLLGTQAATEDFTQAEMKNNTVPHFGTLRIGRLIEIEEEQT